MDSGTVSAYRRFRRTYVLYGSTALVALSPLNVLSLTITLLDTPHSVGLLWASDQPDVEKST